MFGILNYRKTDQFDFESESPLVFKYVLLKIRCCCNKNTYIIGLNFC